MMTTTMMHCRTHKEGNVYILHLALETQVATCLSTAEAAIQTGKENPSYLPRITGGGWVGSPVLPCNRNKGDVQSVVLD